MNQITFFNSCLLPIQQTIFSIKPNLFNVYFIFQGEPFMEGVLAAGIKRLLGKTCLLLTYRTNLSFHYFFEKQIS